MMDSWNRKSLEWFALFTGTLPVACAGPTTPFGALDLLSSPQTTREVASPSLPENSKSYQLIFHPQRQVLHDRTDFSMELRSSAPMNEQPSFQVFHNSIDVTRSFMNNSFIHTSHDRKTKIFTLKDMRLKTLDANDIEVRVHEKHETLALKQSFLPPECSLFDKRELAHLGNFRAPASYMSLIKKVALENNYNPSFLAGVVAQESGFNPKAVSWARAIGLTQVTPLAEREVMSTVQEWPRYPGINSLSYLALKAKILAGEITQEKEWRLDPEKSLRGGMTYIQYLVAYWNREEQLKLIDSVGGDRDHLMTQLILASYNSGASRVKRALQTLEARWMDHESLGEAVHYLRKVSSYCYHYSNHEEQNDSET